MDLPNSFRLAVALSEFAIVLDGLPEGGVGGWVWGLAVLAYRLYPQGPSQLDDAPDASKQAQDDQPGERVQDRG